MITLGLGAATAAATVALPLLNHLLPDRRIRVKARMIKRSDSQYQARGPNIDRRSYHATIGIDIITDT